MRFKTCSLIVLLFLAPVIAYPQNQERALIQELYAKSGLEKQIAQIPALMQASFDQATAEDPNWKSIPEDLRLAMRALAEEAFIPDKLKATVLTELKEKLTDQDIKKVLEWLESPTGKRCTKVEEAAMAAESLVEIEQFTAQMQKAPPPADRLRTIRKLDSATKSTEASVEVMLITSLAIQIALNSTFPVEQQRPLGDIMEGIENNRSQIETMARSQTAILMLYTYRELTDAEIGQYIDFALSPAGSKCQLVMMSGIKKAFFEASLKLGELIGNKMKESKGRSKT